LLYFLESIVRSCDVYSEMHSIREITPYLIFSLGVMVRLLALSAVG